MLPSDVLQSIINFLQAAGSLIWQLLVRVFVRGIFYALFVLPFKAPMVQARLPRGRGQVRQERGSRRLDGVDPVPSTRTRAASSVAARGCPARLLHLTPHRLPCERQGLSDLHALPGAVLRGASAVRAGQRTPCGRCPGDGLRVLGAGPWGR